MDERSLWGGRYAGWMGLLLQSGYSPRLVDASAPWSNADGLRVAILVTSGLLREEIAENILNMAEEGVHLVVCPCWPRNDPSGRQGPCSRSLLERVLPLRSHGAWRHEVLEYQIDGERGEVRPKGPARVYESVSHGDSFLWPRDKEGLVSGMRFSSARGEIFLMGTDLAKEYGSSQFEQMKAEERWRRRRFVRALMGACGARPILDWQNMNVTAWCRRGAKGEAFLFATNVGGDASCAFRFLAPEHMGFQDEAVLSVRNLLEAEKDRTISGTALRREGVPLTLKRYGAAIVRIGPEFPEDTSEEIDS